MKNKVSFFWLIYFFCLIFAPPIIYKLNFLIPLTLFTLIYMLIDQNRNYSKYLFNKQILLGYFVYVFYIVLISLLNMIGNNYIYVSNNIIVYYRLVVLLPFQYICAVFLKVNIVKRETIYKYIVLSGFIQGLIAFATLILPNLKLILVEIMAKNTGLSVFEQETVYTATTNFRFFGFSNTLLDTFGYGMGLIAVLSVFLAMNISKKYFITTPFILLSIFLNSRTGIIIFIIGSVTLLVLNKYTYREYIRTFSYTFALLALIVPIMNFLSKISPNTVYWITSGFENLLYFILRKERSQFEITNVLFSNSFWTFPTSISSIVFGTGHTVYGLKSVLGFHSDVGYVNQFWLNGIIGTLIKIGFIFNILQNALKNISNNSPNENPLIYSLILSALFMMVKADVYSYNPGTIINIILLTSWFFGEEKKEDILIEKNKLYHTSF